MSQARKKDPPNWLIENITEASKNARKIYFGYMLLVFYCALAIFGISDIDYISNKGIRLPIINIDVSLIGFFIFSPLLCIGAFSYLQLYLQRLKGLKSELSDYKQIDHRRLYPWMINIAEYPEEGLIGKFQQAFISISLWWILPLVLIIISLGILKLHNSILSHLIGLSPLIGTIFSIYFSLHYIIHKEKIIKYNKKISFYKYILKLFKIMKIIKLSIAEKILIIIIIVYEIWLHFIIIPYSHDGTIKNFCLHLEHEILVDKNKMDIYLKLHPKNEEKKTSGDIPCYWASYDEMNFNGANLYGNTLRNMSFRLTKFKKAFLPHSDLRNSMLYKADFSNANLKSADLRKANLNGANLSTANLNYAKLTDAKLIEANLFRADLGSENTYERHFKKAKFEWVDFDGTDLKGANLMLANLSEANLKRVNLSKATLLYANLTDAYLSEANLNRASLISANLSKATLKGANLSKANLSSSKLRWADLEGAYFIEANLKNADLRGTNFSKANLKGTDLTNADLRTAIISEKQLSQAKSIKGIKR